MLKAKFERYILVTILQYHLCVDYTRHMSAPYKSLTIPGIPRSKSPYNYKLRNTLPANHSTPCPSKADVQHPRVSLLPRCLDLSQIQR
jgi:hypothetical protein